MYLKTFELLLQSVLSTLQNIYSTILHTMHAYFFYMAVAIHMYDCEQYG